MKMREYLIDTFLFNDAANKKILGKINQLPDKAECIRLFSHLINSQNKWMTIILWDSKAPDMSWWHPVYPYEQLEIEWDKSLHPWISFLQSKTEEQMFEDIEFTEYDSGKWAIKLIDLALQLNYHSIHHRAQMQMLIRQQGIEPDFLDYIGTKYQKIS